MYSRVGYECYRFDWAIWGMRPGSIKPGSHQAPDSLLARSKSDKLRLALRSTCDKLSNSATLPASELLSKKGVDTGRTHLRTGGNNHVSPPQ